MRATPVHDAAWSLAVGEFSGVAAGRAFLDRLVVDRDNRGGGVASPGLRHRPGCAPGAPTAFEGRTRGRSVLSGTEVFAQLRLPAFVNDGVSCTA